MYRKTSSIPQLKGTVHPTVALCSDVSNAARRTLDLLQAAHRLAGGRLKRFVLLGSAVAVLSSFEVVGVAGRDYTEEDWNPVSGPLFAMFVASG